MMRLIRTSRFVAFVSFFSLLFLKVVWACVRCCSWIRHIANWDCTHNIVKRKDCINTILLWKKNCPFNLFVFLRFSDWKLLNILGPINFQCAIIFIFCSKSNHSRVRSSRMMWFIEIIRKLCQNFNDEINFQFDQNCSHWMVNITKCSVMNRLSKKVFYLKVHRRMANCTFHFSFCVSKIRYLSIWILHFMLTGVRDLLCNLMNQFIRESVCIMFNWKSLFLFRSPVCPVFLSHSFTA